MSIIDDVIIDQSKPFSRSMFWQAQRHYYHEKGAEAWAGEVPFFITSNPFIAHHYAKLVIRFIQDWTRKFPEAKSSPFYIIELGVGSGQFSYYVLKALEKLINQFNLNDITLHYIMTDFTENNVKFWEQHEQLKPYVDSQLLDFALFDMEKDNEIISTNHHFHLTPNSVNNPLIVFANYLFDSIINDIFSIKNGEIQESLVSLSVSKKHLNMNMPDDWEKVKITHMDKPISEHHYNDQQLDQTLNAYKDELEDTHLLFPIGCLRGLNNLQKISHNKLFLISSDKGYSTPYELDELEFPELDFHGSFSLMVNYHAIRQYLELFSGDAFIQSPRDGLTTGVFTSGFKLNDLTETKYLLENVVEGFSPTDYFNYYELVESIHEELDLKLLASTLCLSRWDPFLFDAMSDRLAELLEKEDTEIVDYIINHLPNIRDNFYYVPNCEDVLFSIGMIFYTIDHFEEAIEYYRLSEKYFNPTFESLYNIGLCYHYMDEHSQALSFLKRALELDPKNKEIKNLIRESEASL